MTNTNPLAFPEVYFAPPPQMLLLYTVNAPWMLLTLTLTLASA